MDFDEAMSLDMTEEKYAKDRLQLAMPIYGLGGNYGYKGQDEPHKGFSRKMIRSQSRIKRS